MGREKKKKEKKIHLSLGRSEWHRWSHNKKVVGPSSKEKAKGSIAFPSLGGTRCGPCEQLCAFPPS